MTEEYQEIDLLELAKKILRKWWLILILTVLCGYATYYYTMNYVTPIYQARSTLFIGKESGALSSLSIGDVSLGNQLVGDYSQLIRTRLVTEEVIQTLALNQSTGSLIANIGVSVIPETRFIYLTFNDPIPERAAMVVNEISEVLVLMAEEVVGVKNVMIVDYAITPTGPVSSSLSRNVMLGGAVGAVIALGIIFVLMMLDNTIKNEEEIEKMLGIPVLGSIPKFKGAARS